MHGHGLGCWVKPWVGVVPGVGVMGRCSTAGGDRGWVNELGWRCWVKPWVGVGYG